MKRFNFLSKSSSQSCSHSVVTLASTVGSPSAHRRGTMLKLLSVLVLILTLGVGNVWGTATTVKWVQVTAAPSTWAGEYLLVYQGTSTTAGVAWTGTDAASCGANVTISSGVIASKPDAAASLTIASITNGYSIKVNGGNLNGKYIGGLSGSNTISNNTSAILNTISYDNTNKCVITSNTSVMRYNSANNNLRFRYFKSAFYSNQQKVELYKQVTLSSISVKTAPSKTTYTEGEYFAPAGLVITKTWSDNSTEDITYNNTTASDFSFSPSTALTTSNVSVTITYGGKSTSQAITVAASACTKKVTLATGNPSNGTISFSPTGPVETCDGNVNVTMTITPNAGYYLSAYSPTGVSTSNTPSITTGTSATAAQTPTLTFAQNANGTYTAGATFTAFVDHFIDDVQSSTGYTGEGMAKSGNYSNSLPTISDKAVATTGNCQALHYHFVGWVLSDYKDSPTGHIATLNGHATGATYYAVWAKAGTGGASYTAVTSISEGVYVMVSEKTSNTYRYMPNTTSSSSNPALGSGITMSTTAGVTTLTNAVTDAMLWDFTLKSGSIYYIRPHGSTTIGLGTTTSGGANIRISESYKNMEWTIATSDDYGWQFKNNATTNMYLAVYADDYWRCYNAAGTNQNGTFYLFKQTVSYTDYITDCCTELGSINGSVSMSQTSAALEWADLAHVSSWAVKYKTHDAANWSDWDGEQATANSKRSVTITGLTCGTAYDFKIAATAAAGYCDAEQVLENQSTTKWNISYSLSNTVALSTGPAQGANACGDFSATFSKNASYTFPENITVQVGGATLAAANYTWNNTNGTLSIDGQYITGNVVVTIAGVAPANPIVTPNPAALSFDQVKKGADVPAAQDIAITGHNLTAALTVTSSNPLLYAVSVKSGSLTPDGNKDASPVITVTPQAGITSTAGDKDATITISGGGLASNVVVNVTFNVQETYTVNWYVNGSDNAHKARTQTDIVGTDLTEIPSDFTGVTDCSEKVFKGWTETANYSDENDAPADLITSTTGMKITAANKNYYAVFADKEGEDSNSWDLVTSASSLQENDIITLTSTCTYNYSSTAYYDTVAYAGKNNTLGAVASIGITNNKIRTVKSGSISEVKLVGGSSSGKWKLYDIAAEEYLNDANKAISYEESGDDVTIAISDGVATITDGDYTLQYNPNNNAGDYTKARFAYYSSTQKAIQIYKKTVTSATYSNYVVVCPHYPRVTLSAAYSTTPANGSISFAVNSEAVTNVRTDGDDAVVDVVASPTTGYELTGLTLTSDDVTGATKNQALTQITIPEDEEGTLTVTATFAQKNYSIAVESYPASIGATLTGTTSTAKYGVEQTISTNEPTGYIFGGWYMYDAEDTGKETDLSPELFTGTYEGGDLELSASFLMPDRNLVAEAYFDKIYTPAEALALNDLSDSVFVEGIISQVDEVSTQYKNATYWISADGTTTNQIKIYRGKHLNNGDVTSSNAGQIAVGNKVIIRGKLSQNSNINQFGQGASYIYDLTEKVLSSIVVSAPDASLVKTEYFGTTETFSYAGLKATAEYNTGYQKDVTDDATWKANGSASLTVATGGTVNVTATYGGETSSNYGVAVTVTTKTLESITVSPAALTGYKGQALPKPTTVTANFDDQGVASSSNVTAQAVYDEAGDYSASSTSAQTIAVKYTFGPTTKSANYTVTLSSIENTLNTAYSVTEARAIIDLDQVEGNDLDLANNLVYVEGIITAKTTNEITIKDVTDATKTIVLYKSTLGTGISSVDVNDRIKALGVLKLYNNTKYEMDEDCEIVWKQPKVGITIANKTLEVGDVWTINATIDPAAAPVTYSIKDGSDDCVTLATNVITATAVGTATIVVTAEDYNEYLGNSKEFTVTVSPAKVHTDVIILAEYNGHYYALNNTAGTTEVQFENGMVIVPDQATKMAILWDRAEREGVATFYNAKASKFLNGGTSTTLGVATEEGTYTSWTWVETETKAYYTSNSGGSARTFMYMNGQSIKNYAVSNIGNGSYAQANVYAGAVAVKISSNTDVSDLPENASVLVEEGVTLTVDAASTLDNLIVENGGTVEVAGSNELTVVNNLTIQTTSGSTENQGKSGQLTGSVMPVVSGDLFIEIKLCEGAMDAEASRKWYCISAPFNVNMNGGFFWGDGTQMVLNTDFQLFEWDGDRRATGISGWKRVSGVMKAGIAYFIGFDDERSNQNIIKLKATNKTISNKSSINAPEHSSSVDDKYANWNGLANPNFRHIALNKDVQAFDHNIQAYTTYGTGDYNFVVGTPFFIKETGDITIEAADNSSFRAPKREVEQLSYCVRIVREGKAGFDNQMYVRASEEARASYEEGHDLVTMNAETSNYGALLWTVNYGGKRLAIEEAPLVNDKASYALSLYAPADGAYRIETPTVREDASLYLTYEGNIIWDLSAGAYELELNKGATEGYGLMLVRKAPQVTTGVENVQGDKIQCTKVILNDHVYILRDAQLYDVTGKAVK